MLHLLSIVVTILSVGATDLGILIAEGAVVVGAGAAVTTLGVKIGKKKKENAKKQAEQQFVENIEPAEEQSVVGDDGEVAEEQEAEKVEDVAEETVAEEKDEVAEEVAEESEQEPEEVAEETTDDTAEAQEDVAEEVVEEKLEEVTEETTEETTEEATEEAAEQSEITTVNVTQAERTESGELLSDDTPMNDFEKYNSLNDDVEEIRRHIEESKSTIGQETPTPAGDGQSWEQVKDYNAAVMPIILNNEEDADEDDKEEGEEGEPAGDDELKSIVDEEGNELQLSYRKSFEAKIIQSDKILKDYYSLIVAELLSYKKIKSRKSWGAETFTLGRKAKAKLTMRGKTLALYLALNPAEQEAKYHLRDCSEKKRYADVPALMRVKSTRAVKYAKELIAMVMEDTVKLPEEPVISEIPYEKTSALVGKGLIKVIANGGKAHISDDLMQEIAATQDKSEKKFSLSFQAKIIRADDKLQAYYSAIKNELLSYKKVKARSSWGAETFNIGREAKAKLTVRGKSLVCYLALDPKKYENTKYFFRDLSEKKKYAVVPMQLKIKSDRGLKYAKELIADAMYGVEKLNVEHVDYTSEYKDIGQLIKEGLVK